MWPAQQRSQHLAGLVAVVVNGLLAQNHQLWLFLFNQCLEQFGNRQRLQFFSCFDQNRTVCTNGHGSAQGFLALQHAATYSNDFCYLAFFAHPRGLFDGDFVKRVHAHFDVGDINTGAIGFDADFNVVVDYTFDRDQDLHCAAPEFVN